jgi:malate synthase
MSDRIREGGLQIAPVLHDLLTREITPGTGIAPQQFWQGLESLVRELGPKNRQLLAVRDDMQARIDAWHQASPGADYDRQSYKRFLKEIGYLLPEGEDFSIETSNVDEEVATLAGPQLVVPVMNARYALNAANARWGSLYDALYGTDVIPEDNGAEKNAAYNPVRGERVVAYGRDFLNRHCPLNEQDHSQAKAYKIVGGTLEVTLLDGQTSILGRSPDNAIVLPDGHVSGQHAEIHREGHQYVLQDLGSANGVLVGGKESRRTYLRGGEIIEIYPYEFRFELDFDVTES